MISGQNVSTMCNMRKRTKTGIIVTCAGSMSVESISMNKMFRPRKLKRAKPKPTRLQEIT